MDKLHQLKDRVKNLRIKGRREEDDAPASGRKRDQKQVKKMGKGPSGGHIFQQSGSVYQSQKGKGDVLKPGQHEPYAYIKLNPEMLNHRKKAQAVQSFASVVSVGKKTDKRTNKRKDGFLAGLKTEK